MEQAFDRIERQLAEEREKKQQATKKAQDGPQGICSVLEAVLELTVHSKERAERGSQGRHCCWEH